MALIGLLLLPAVPVGAEITAPGSGLTEGFVAGIPLPTDIDVNAAGDMLVASQSGGLYLRTKDAAPSAFNRVLNLGGSICADGERGLLGAVFDPDFDLEDAANRYVYLFYTARVSGGCPTGPEPTVAAQTVRSSAARVAPAARSGEVADAASPSAKKRALERCERIEKPNRRANCRTRTNRSFRPSSPSPAPSTAPPVAAPPTAAPPPNAPIAPAPAPAPRPPAGTTVGQPVNRVARFAMGANGIVAGSPTVLVDNIPSPASNHNGGDVDFGNDGHLYVSVGDGGANASSAQDPSKLLGKILRVDKETGQAPGSNPYAQNGVRCGLAGRGPAGSLCREVFALGLRNPFRIAFDPNAGQDRFYINDVGAGTTEEIDLGIPNANYGWPGCEGSKATSSTTVDCPIRNAQDPVAEYGRSTGCGSITGGAFTPTGALGGGFETGYFFADFRCKKLFVLKDGQQVEVARNLGLIVPLAFAPDGSLYYGTYGDSPRGIAPGVYRISATGAQAPVRVGQAVDARGGAERERRRGR